jgi:hypothetical protein
MPRGKKPDTDEAWGFYGGPPHEEGRSARALAELVRNTKLRTLHDMSEREIRALERFYGCPVIRPARLPKSSRQRNRAVLAALVA